MQNKVFCHIYVITLCNFVKYAIISLVFISHRQSPKRVLSSIFIMSYRIQRTSQTQVLFKNTEENGSANEEAITG